ncbi:MAG: 30S ribosomal protein S15 [Candidatus Hydrothermarchaeaceae archaeon]
MARMYSRKKGKSGSTRPVRTAAPKWVEHSTKELEEIIVKLAKKGENPSKIGIILRDQYGVPLIKTVSKKKITQILAKNEIKPKIPEDMMNLLRRAVNLDRHNTTNHKDMGSKRGMQLTEAKIRRLANYYKSAGRLPEDWKYNLKQAKLTVK